VESEIHYRQALACDPYFADAHCYFGNLLKDLGRIDESIQYYLNAIRIRPDYGDAHANLANSYKDSGRVDVAVQQYQVALRLKPDSVEIFCNFVHSLQLVCAWAHREQNLQRLVQMTKEQLQKGLLPSVQPFHAMVYPLSPQLTVDISVAYAQKALDAVAPSLPSVQQFVVPHEAQLVLDADPRLKIGYVSSDFREHPLAHLMQNVFRFHDRARYKIVCYALSADDGSPYRAAIQAGAEYFTEIHHLPVDQAAQQIKLDGIQILVNLNGYTKGACNELFALEPAPLQVSYMGFCSTLGAKYVPYLITDEITSPPSSQEYYTEHLLYMPHSYFVNDHMQSHRSLLANKDMPVRSQYGIPSDKFVFANFNQLYKIDPIVFDSWARILRRAPNSVLWLLRFPPYGEANIRMEAQARGIPDGQIIFTDVAPKDEHIRRGVCADLFLDTTSCNGHTTGWDILWSGTPMITCPGQSMCTRVAASLLTAIGCPELIAEDMVEYEDIAVRFATDVVAMQEQRQKIIRNRETKPLFQTQRWVQNLQRLYDELWRRHAAGEQPSGFKVQDPQDIEGATHCQTARPQKHHPIGKVQEFWPV
jgi:protein O-GlcNAc transferase